eukprot:15862115-Heterocapsa_arctica.AAC.1
MREEHDVHHGLAIQLEGLEDEVPEGQGTIICSGLDEPPIGGQPPVEALEVVPLEPGEGRVLEVLQPSQ